MTFQPAAQTFQAPVPTLLHDLLADAQRAPPADLRAAHAVLARLAELAGDPPDRREAVEPDHTGLAPWKARRISAHIEARLGGAISNTELARVANLSVSYFCRAFKKTFGETAHLHIVRRRVALAQRMMTESRQPLCDIALGCGFADQAHMTRIFTRLVGTSPNRWRRAHGPVLQ